MSTIITRNSANSGSVPSSLVQGELAINVTDGRLFYGSGSGNVVKEFTASGSGGGTTNTGSLLTTASFSDPNLTFTKGNGSTFNVNISSLTVTSASYALTASYVNPLNQNVIITGSLLVTQSYISTVDYIDFTLLPAEPAFNTGRLHWTDDTKTLQLDTDVNNFELEIGHQSVIRGRNVNSFTLTKGSVVYINGESGNRPTFATASWTDDSSSATTIGIIAQDINSSQTGYAVTNGLIRDINTNAFPPGTSLYLSSSGQYTSVPPLSPLHEVRLGKTITQATNGIIYIDIQNGYEIGELHDVLITSASTGDLLVWDSGSQVWENTKQLSGSYGLTGSLTATSFTGSLLGTASYATQALSASFSITSSAANIADASDVNAQFHIAFVANTGSTQLIAADRDGLYNPKFNTLTVTSSFALTASYVPPSAIFPYTGSARITGSLGVTGSLSVIDGNGTNNLNTNVRTLYGTNSSSSVDWANRLLSAANGSTRLDWRNLYAIDSNTTRSIDWGNRQLIDTNFSRSVEWNSRISYDVNQSSSINWSSRDLTDTNESASLNWNSRLMSDSGAPGGSGISVSSIDWESRATYDSAGNQSTSWEGRYLTDGAANVSVDWASRFMNDQNNNNIIDYSGGNGYSITNYRPTIENLSLDAQNNFTQTQVFGLSTNVAGNIITVNPNVDLAVTASNPVFLDTDGIWKRSDQTTDTTTKLLGICVEPYNKGQILTEGIITVTTASGYGDTTPFVSGSNFYGMPVYLTGSAATFTTTKPISGYVRVVGHMYYNSTSNPDYWIMKFNPSNDWYEI